MRAVGLVALVGVLILSIFTVASSNVDLYAQTQETYPDSIFASTNQAQLHELLLKATEENGQTNSVPGFSIDLTNVISVPTNSELDIFTTDNSLSINEAKVKSTTNSFIDLVKQSQNSFSLTGLAAGVYTVDVITQKGNSRAAYEGILVLGQEPTNPQTRTIIEQQIVREEEDDDSDNGGDCDPSYPGVCIPRFPPDLDCGDVRYTDFKVLPPDPHDFDREGDGIGCETGGGNNEDNVGILPDPCLTNPTLLQCVPPDPCIDNPNLPECLDPCIENPGAEGCPEPIDPCDEDPSLPGCQDEDTGSDVGDEGDGDSSDEESGDENDEDAGGEGEENEGGEEGEENEGGGDEEAGADEE